MLFASQEIMIQGVGQVSPTPLAKKKTAREITRRSRRLGFRRRGLSGVGRSASQKRAARAAWVQAHLDETDSALQMAMNNIGTGRSPVTLTVPPSGDEGTEPFDPNDLLAIIQAQKEEAEAKKQKAVIDTRRPGITTPKSDITKYLPYAALALFFLR